MHISFRNTLFTALSAIQLNKNDSWEIVVAGLIAYNSIGKYGDYR